MTLDDETTDVLIGGYLSKDAAEEDYNAVLGCGGACTARSSSARTSKATSTVEQTDHMVAEGAAGLGAVGFAVGLFAPPLLAATAVGAVIGAGAGKLLHHKTTEKLGEQAGETIPIGGAGLIVAYPRSAPTASSPPLPARSEGRSARPKGTTSRPSRARSRTPRQKMAQQPG